MQKHWSLPQEMGLDAWDNCFTAAEINTPSHPVQREASFSLQMDEKAHQQTNTKFPPLKSLTTTLCPDISRFSYSKDSNKLIPYAKSKNIEGLSHKSYKNVQLFVKSALEFIVQYLLLLFAFAKTKIDKPVIASSAKVIWKTFTVLSQAGTTVS